MIINFKVKNFRSLKDQIELSMEASASKAKPDNMFEVETKAGKIYRLLKTAVIYGPNASGKSNIILAYNVLRQLVTTSFRNDVNDTIKGIEPFELSAETEDQPTEFTFEFIGHDKYQYIYYLSISKMEGILEESLKYYEATSPILIYKRKGRSIIHSLPKFFNDIIKPKFINPKRLLLSEFGNTGSPFWENLRNYFVLGTAGFSNASNRMISILTEASKRVFEGNNPGSEKIKEQVIDLVRKSDIGIRDLDLQEEMVVLNRRSSEDTSDELGNYSRKEKRFKTYHDYYENNELKEAKQLDLLLQGSAGTRAIIGVSTEIIISLNRPNGRTLWIDELDNSLHPHLCRFLVELYHHPRSNPNNAQLIFATHETTLLDRNMFRRDQIWITSKNKYGITEFYSIYDLDIEGLREDIPFDRWYISGKFGGIPKIKSQDFIYQRDKIVSNGKA